MRDVSLGLLRLEGHPTENGSIRIRVIVKSEMGQQEVFVSLREWSSLQTLQLALRLADERSAKDRAEIVRLDGELAKARVALLALRATINPREPANG